MSLVGSLALVSLLPQLRVETRAPAVGHEVVLRIVHDDRPAQAIEVEVELPDGSRQSIGRTDGDGLCRFVPDRSGPHVFTAAIDGTRALAPFFVAARRRQWPLALATVPLGLALLWWNLRRARDRRGS